MSESQHLETDQLTEYQQAHEWWRHLVLVRRQDFATFTAIQGAAVTIVGDRLLHLTSRETLLSVMAFSRMSPSSQRRKSDPL